MANLDTTRSAVVAVHQQAQIGIHKFATILPRFLGPVGVMTRQSSKVFNALLFLFKHVLEKDFDKVKGVVRAKRKPYIPVVLSRDEIDRIIARLAEPYALVVKLLYGCGLRLFECLQLRVQDLNFVIFAIASPVTCCRPTTTFAPFRSCWGTATCAGR
jgi:integrase